MNRETDVMEWEAISWPREYSVCTCKRVVSVIAVKGGNGDLSVVGPLVRDEEGGADGAAGGVGAARVEQLVVERPVDVVDGVVERQQHHLRRLARPQPARDARAAAAARRQLAARLAPRRHAPLLLLLQQIEL